MFNLQFNSTVFFDETCMTWYLKSKFRELKKILIHNSRN